MVKSKQGPYTLQSAESGDFPRIPHIQRASKHKGQLDLEAFADLSRYLRTEADIKHGPK